MGHWIYHWLYQDFWVPVWPNLAASLLVWAFMWWKLHAMRGWHEEMLRLQVHHHHEQMKAIRAEDS